MEGKICVSLNREQYNYKIYVDQKMRYMFTYSETDMTYEVCLELQLILTSLYLLP